MLHTAEIHGDKKVWKVYARGHITPRRFRKDGIRSWQAMFIVMYVMRLPLSTIRIRLCVHRLSRNNIAWNLFWYDFHTQTYFIVSEHYPNHLEILVTECMRWCDGYGNPLFVPLVAWLPKPYTPMVTSFEVSNCHFMSTAHSSQHILCGHGTSDLVLYHSPSGKRIKIFSGQ